MLYHDGCEFHELWNCFICPKEGRQYFWQYHQFFKTHQAGSNQLNETAGTEYFIRSAKVKMQILKIIQKQNIYRKYYIRRLGIKLVGCFMKTAAVLDRRHDYSKNFCIIH